MSCTKGQNIPELRAKITELAASLRMMAEQWPADWVKAADAIHALGKPHVLPEQVFDAMATNGVTSNAQQTLAGWLRELGDIVYYGDGSALGDLVVLQPEWVAQEISRILESDKVREGGGILLRTDVNELWHATPSAVRDLLCRLMDHYDLTYNTEHQNEIGIVVECLARAPTDFRSLWDSSVGKPELRMRFQFRSELPPGIPTWFIAREHRFTTHNQWRDGALFQKGDDLCLIQTIRESREVSLTVRGTQPAYFFGVMLDGFDQTLNRYPGLDANLERYIPCPKRRCAGEFGYADLLGKLERSGPNKTAECGKCDTVFTLAQLLYAIPEPEIAAMVRSIKQTVERGFNEMSRQFTLQLKRAQNERDNDCPGVFELHPRHGIDVLRTTLEAWLGALRGESAEMELSLYCEFHGEWHPTAHSVYQFKTDAAWLSDLAPYWKKVTAVLKLAPHAREAVELTEAFISMETHRHSELSEMMEARYDRDPAWGAARTRLRELLRELDKQRADPATHWGGLTQVFTPEGEVLWVCPQHKSELFPNPR